MNTADKREWQRIGEQHPSVTPLVDALLCTELSCPHHGPANRAKVEQEQPTPCWCNANPAEVPHAHNPQTCG